MFLARSKAAPRCDRCGAVLAPLSACSSCRPRASFADDSLDAELEALIAAALPTSASPRLTAEEPTSSRPGILHAPSYDPEDRAIPRDPDFFARGRSGSWIKQRLSP